MFTDSDGNTLIIQLPLASWPLNVSKTREEPRSLFYTWAKFPILQKYLLEHFSRIYIWQVSPQLSCGDINI